jgi:phosphatidylethanolamine-binding protein (PEBP) family uncharacterized protein
MNHCFAEGERISKYMCNGDNINPLSNIKGITKGTITLVMIVDDLDASMRN